MKAPIFSKPGDAQPLLLLLSSVQTIFYVIYWGEDISLQIIRFHWPEFQVFVALIFIFKTIILLFLLPSSPKHSRSRPWKVKRLVN